MMRRLLRIWKHFPPWTHLLAAELLRPRFRVAVSAIVFDEQQRILLFKHTYRKLEWGLPAGALEYGEQPVDGILREFLEETGMTIAVERLLLAESAAYIRHVSLVYLCKIVSGDFRESDEISEICYFDVNSLPPMLFDEKELIRSVHKQLFVTLLA
jgi:ADP-ribose pyrophosphatase YjhB (NUDIX family)